MKVFWLMRIKLRDKERAMSHHDNIALHVSRDKYELIKIMNL